MPGMMYIPPDKRENPMANMGMNFLMQLAMSKIAHDRRMEEQDRQLEAMKIEKDSQRDYEEKKASRPPTYYEFDGKKFVVHGGTLLQVKDEEKKDDLTGTQKDYERAKTDPEFAKYLREKATYGQNPYMGRDQNLQELQATNALSNEFTNRSKDFLNVRDSWNRVQASSKSPSAAGDLALIFNYMKMLDPGSTVREGEFANAAASGAFGDRIQAAAKKIISGERLSEDMRSDFLRRAGMLYKEQEGSHKQLSSQFKEKAIRYRLNPDDVVQDYLKPQKVDIPSEAQGTREKNKLTKEQEELYKKYHIVR